MDCVADTLWNGRRIKALTAVGTWNRESVWIEVIHSLPGRVLRAFWISHAAPAVVRIRFRWTMGQSLPPGIGCMGVSPRCHAAIHPARQAA